MAVGNGNMNTVDVLIQQQANVHGGDNIMRTVSQVTVGALVTNTVEGGTMIYLRVTGSAPIHVAAAHGQTNTVEALVEWGCDVNMVSRI